LLSSFEITTVSLRHPSSYHLFFAFAFAFACFFMLVLVLVLVLLTEGGINVVTAKRVFFLLYNETKNLTLVGERNYYTESWASFFLMKAVS
jgi:hypothetical protein